MLRFETCALERDVPEERVISLKETLGEDGSEDFEIIEDLTTTAVFSTIEEKQRLAHQATTVYGSRKAPSAPRAAVDSRLGQLDQQ